MTDSPSPIVNRRSFVLILGLFAAFGVTWGIWAVVIADLKAALGLSDGALGAALTIGTVASLPAMFYGGALADRLGVRHVIVAAALIVAAGMAGLYLVDGYAVLLLLLLVLFGSSGVYDVGINAAAVGYEQRTHRRVMTYFHGVFSGAAAAGALLAGVLLTAGVAFRLLYLLLAALLACVAVLVWRSRRLPERGAAGGVKSSGLYRNPAILVVGVITGLGMLSEGALEAWSAIYLRSHLELPAVLGASGVAVFHTAMCLGRLGAGPVVARISRRTLLQGAGGLAAAGMALALATPQPALILSGFLIVGLGLSIVVPVAFSVAGDLAPGRAGEAASVVAVMGYAGFLLGPAVIGGIAQGLGLRLALAIVIAAGAAVVVLGMRVRAGASASPSPPNP